MSWNKVPIKTICKGIYDGPHATPPESSSGAVFLGIPNFINGQLDLSNIRYISEQDLPKWTKRVTPQPNDIVFSYEATLNLYAIIPKGFWGCLGRRMALIRVDEKKADYKFLYYYFYSTAWRSVIQEHTVTGATVDRIPLVSFPDFLVELPDLPTQRRIASILSAYDDLIENNRRQIKLLEEAAQRLYREWFVELRFPGHESVKVVDGVPEGWKKQKLVDIADVQYGFAFDGKCFNNQRSGTPIIRIRNIPDGTTSDYTTESADSRYVVHNGEIVVGMDGEFHINTWNGEDAYLVQRTCCIRPTDKALNGWLLYAIYEPIKFYEKTVVGSTVAHLGKKHVDTIELLTSPSNLYKPFVALYKKRQVLLNQNRKLSKARDHLLPKLMSREMEV